MKRLDRIRRDEQTINLVSRLRSRITASSGSVSHDVTVEMRYSGTRVSLPYGSDEWPFSRLPLLRGFSKIKTFSRR